MNLTFSLWVPAPLQWCWLLGVLWLRAQCAHFSHDVHLHPHLVTTSQPLLSVALRGSPLWWTQPLFFWWRVKGRYSTLEGALLTPFASLSPTEINPFHVESIAQLKSGCRGKVYWRSMGNWREVWCQFMTLGGMLGFQRESPPPLIISIPLKVQPLQGQREDSSPFCPKLMSVSKVCIPYSHIHLFPGGWILGMDLSGEWILGICAHSRGNCSPLTTEAPRMIMSEEATSSLGCSPMTSSSPCT